MKALVVADVKWWAFAKIYRALKKYLTDWQVDVHYVNHDGEVISHEEYSVVLFLCDHHYRLIKKNGMPKEKVILAVRSDRKDPIYNNAQELQDTAVIIAASNQAFQERYSKLHPRVILAPGGVDTDIFYYKERVPPEKLKVGWAGSSKNFGEEFRGLDIIQKVCDDTGNLFVPAIREERLRNEEEMVEYYHNEIDLYVDLSLTAGRQNGLLEAGACGIPVISCRAGIAEDLIVDRFNGFLCDRNTSSLDYCMRQVVPAYTLHGSNIRRSVEEKWSWRVQSDIFRKMFEEVVKNS